MAVAECFTCSEHFCLDCGDHEKCTQCHNNICGDLCTLEDCDVCGATDACPDCIDNHDCSETEYQEEGLDNEQ